MPAPTDQLCQHHNLNSFASTKIADNNTKTMLQPDELKEDCQVYSLHLMLTAMPSQQTCQCQGCKKSAIILTASFPGFVLQVNDSHKMTNPIRGQEQHTVMQQMTNFQPVLCRHISAKTANRVYTSGHKLTSYTSTHQSAMGSCTESSASPVLLKGSPPTLETMWRAPNCVRPFVRNSADPPNSSAPTCK